MSLRHGSVKGSSSSLRVSSGRHSSGGGYSCGSYGGSLGGGQGGNVGGGVCIAGGSGFGGGSSFGGGAGFGGGSGFGGAAGSHGGFYGSGGGHGGGFVFGDDHGLFPANEKMTMQNLNDRLASYLGSVKSLEDHNTELEAKIRHWYETHGPKPAEDYSHYYRKIEECQKKIIDQSIDNARIVLQIDNARLASDDFRCKYEAELQLRQSVETDINGLRRVLDELTLNKSDLESQIEFCSGELMAVRKNHDEEMKVLRQQVVGTVSVDMKAAPGIDMQKVLNDMRHEYEGLIAQNQKEIEQRYHEQTVEVNKQVTTSSQEIKMVQTEIIELTRTFQTLEIELQTQLSMKAALEGSLADTEERYCIQLAQFQALIQKLEADMSALRCEMENQNQEYKILLDIKSRLEQEISTYRALMDGSGIQMPKSYNDQSYSSNYSSGSQSDKQGGSVFVRTRVEDADGRVISSRDQHHQSTYRK
uniref:IF rod domain-containing protein n=1 Tax=Leptobrachium leishanense TaxID=445787 RepID=A0A8C5QH72_9ANUR